MARLERVVGVELAGTLSECAEDLEKLEWLVSRWSRAVGLTGFKSEDERDRRYFGEALKALSWLPAEGRALDIGSGGGSPALPLAVARRSITWTLVEAHERKAMFLQEAVGVLGLDAEVVHARYEKLAPKSPLDVVTVRGVAATDALFDKAATEIGAEGRLLWFSSEARLIEGVARLQGRWARLAGPVELVARGGFLAVLAPLVPRR